MRTAFYVRVSTERQQQAQTIEQQVALLRAYVAERPDWVVEEQHVFRDDGHTGAKLQRPGLDALRDQAARAAFDIVLITAPDRLARNYVHQMVILEELERHGINVVFIDRQPSDDPHEQLVLQIRGAVAEYERTLIADRMRRGRQAKLRAGRLLPWTIAPYGFRIHPDRPRDPALVEVDEAGAAIVRELFQAYSDGEATLHALAVRLTTRGIASPTGRRFWSATSVRVILTNPAYIGEAISGRLQSRPSRRRRSALEPVGRGVSVQPAPHEQWITVPVPAIISSELFSAAQQRLATNKQLARRNTIYPYLLRGMISCGHCQLSCTGRPGHPSAKYHYYACRGKLPTTTSTREQHCPSRLIPADQLDAVVWDDLCQVVQHPEIVAHQLQRAQAGEWVPQELRRRQASLRTVRLGLSRQQARLLEAYLAGVLDLATFENKRDELRRREEDILAREREVVAQGQQLVAVQCVAGSTTAILEQLAGGLEQASFEQRRELVELLVDRVVVTDDAVEIRYVIPTTETSTRTRFCQLRTDYFDSLAHFLTAVVSRRLSGASVDRATAATGVLGDVRRDTLSPQAPDALACVIALVSTECGRMKPAHSSIADQLRQHISLSRTSCRGDLKVHQQSMSIFHERLTHVAEASFLSRTFAIQPGIGIGPTLVSCVRTLLMMEVDPTIIRAATVWPFGRWWLVFRSKALEAGSRFDQRAIDAEVLVAQQVQAIRVQHHCIEELATDSVAQQPRTVLGKRAVIKARLDHVHIQKPTEQQVISQLLTEGALAADRVQTDQQTGFQQPFWRNGGTPFASSRVHLIEQRRQLQQRCVCEALDRPQRMVRWNQRLRIDKRQHAGLLLGPSAHCRDLRRWCQHGTFPSSLTGRARKPKSTPC